jgi:hypothetical protein
VVGATCIAAWIAACKPLAIMPDRKGPRPAVTTTRVAAGRGPWARKNMAWGEMSPGARHTESLARNSLQEPDRKKPGSSGTMLPGFPHRKSGPCERGEERRTGPWCRRSRTRGSVVHVRVRLALARDWSATPAPLCIAKNGCGGRARLFQGPTSIRRCRGEGVQQNGGAYPVALWGGRPAQRAAFFMDVSRWERL